ncbi:bile acid:sodium symporter family protein [Jiulongibacter sediminis]|uniref:Bile acid:sodium symporter n=1 Tax=Jiulongibacter sediminis TaxID=1605367 RepID=A0A0P7BCG4_9BACT|nr:bile acid:sodium symporter family protein [Jiulongibacter sediminis]KPM48265.1 bile acid:sodium symporter [Jiulongibacter sediminis]TBX24806.1 bile acid:sodium symporter [Jiulongibacter sediminis]
MRNNIYTIVIILVVIITYNFPQYFIEVGDVKLTSLITPVLQIIMFGMGTTITLNDFVGIVKTPKKVIIGVVLQFLVMPFWGFGIAYAFGFPPEIAAGIILIGSSPSGLASNVIAMLAKANVALSITLTTFATMLAPIMTPTLMQYLGGEFIDVDFLGMMWSMCKMVIIPVAFGFLLNRYTPKFVASIKKILPLFSMAGIAYVIGTVTAAGHDSLSTVGAILFLAVLIHNVGGYVFGYFAARGIGMDERDSRTISIEVGMQNGGLASALAVEMGKVATVGLASAIFGPLMNVTGSLLASWWGKKEIKE